MPGSLDYSTALVTGASSGLGLAFSRMLMAAGIKVWGTSRDPDRLREADPAIRPLKMEAKDVGSVNEAWRLAQDQSGGIDLLVNNAGAALFGPFHDATAEKWEEQVAILLSCPARLARHASRAMVGKKRGAIVNVTSMVVEFPIPFLSGYNTAKSGLAALSASLMQEIADSDVIVIDFRPGDFRTAFNNSMQMNSEHIDGDESLAAVWQRLEDNLAGAPEAAVAARDLRRALIRGRSGVVRSGSFFQARMAPLLNRFAPQRLSRFCQRKFFHLG